MKNYKRWLWLAIILIVSGATWWVISGLDAELQEGYDVITDDTLVLGTAVGTYEDGEWNYDSGGAFFVEYRMQRDRTRAQAVEMLEDVLNNPNASSEAKAEAEAVLLEIIAVMEQELLVENMIKAQGYEDALFFYRNRIATVMIKQAELSEREFVQITETVAGVIGIEREDVQVITRP